MLLRRHGVTCGIGATAQTAWGICLSVLVVCVRVLSVLCFASQNDVISRFETLTEAEMRAMLVGVWISIAVGFGMFIAFLCFKATMVSPSACALCSKKSPPPGFNKVDGFRCGALNRPDGRRF
jgi:uncharacterized membrane protein